MNPEKYSYKIAWVQPYTEWNYTDATEVMLEVMEVLNDFPEAKQVIDSIKSKL